MKLINGIEIGLENITRRILPGEYYQYLVVKYNFFINI
jgi:hypothetical protein